jgi:Xaa-Pro dipeptidase
MREKVAQAQRYLRERNFDGWLVYDFHRSNPLAHRFLEIPSSSLVTRRFFYWIPKEGAPIQLLHAIEPHILDRWPGEKRIYSSWQSMEAHLQEILKGCKRVAMEYSPNNQIPYVSKVDGGTLERIRSLGVEVVSSADFLLYFTSVLSEEQMQSQRRAASALQKIVEGAWREVQGALHSRKAITERSLQEWILGRFEAEGWVTDEPPIVAVNAHSADPHFETPSVGSSEIRPGDWLLIDLWAKEKGEGAVFGDLTKVAVVAAQPTSKQRAVFELVRRAQRAAIQFVRNGLGEGKRVEGWEVDEAARSVIVKGGFGAQFLHRTGHNIEVELHGSGTHMDNLEMHDTRPVLPRTCFSVEPGVYLAGEFGVRLESDVIVVSPREIEVTGGEQEEIFSIRHS